jgi:hypothetical protein
MDPTALHPAEEAAEDTELAALAALAGGDSTVEKVKET